jgi:hypothetical protein
MSASKATPVAICIMPVATELLDWMPAIGSKSITGDESPTATNDKLILDAELALNADFAKVTGKTIGTVSGLEYSYTHDSKTLVISKTSGAFDPADVAKVVEAIQLKNTDADSQ